MISALKRSVASCLRLGYKACDYGAFYLDRDGDYDKQRKHFTFSFNVPLILGTPKKFEEGLAPLDDFTPQNLATNAPTYGFATLGCVIVSREAVLYGGSEDAFNYSKCNMGSFRLYMPHLPRSRRAYLMGEYTGYCPTPYTKGDKFMLCVTMTGQGLPRPFEDR
jgi:hypothetical protein